MSFSGDISLKLREAEVVIIQASVTSTKKTLIDAFTINVAFTSMLTIFNVLVSILFK